MCDQDPQKGAGTQEVVEGWEKKDLAEHVVFYTSAIPEVTWHEPLYNIYKRS